MLNAKGQLGLCAVGALAFGLFGLFMFPWMRWNERRVAEMLTWPSTNAEIVRADVGVLWRRNGPTEYFHELAYRYSADGRTYVGDRATYGGPRPYWTMEAEARGNLPSVGSALQVRYNPRDPADSVARVIRVEAWKMKLYPWLALVVGLGGGAVMVMSGRAWRRERRRETRVQPG